MLHILSMLYMLHILSMLYMLHILSMLYIRTGLIIFKIPRATTTSNGKFSRLHRVPLN